MNFINMFSLFFMIVIAIKHRKEITKTIRVVPFKIASASFLCLGNIIANSYLPVDIVDTIVAKLK